MLSKRENVEHAWISKKHVTEFKDYTFKEEFNENHNHWSSIKVTKNDESIAKLSKSTSQNTLKSVSLLSQKFFSNSNSNTILSRHKNNSQINLISSQLYRVMNAEHLFIRFFNIEFRKTTKKDRMNEIDLSSDEKIIWTKIEKSAQSDLLINIAVKKLVAVKIIVEKINKMNIKHVEKWMREIEFFKQVRKNAEFNIHEIITTKINEIKRVVKIEAAKRNEIKESMKHFSKTQKRIFKHNWNELSKILKDWENLKNKTAQLMKKRNKLNTKKHTKKKAKKVWHAGSSKQEKRYNVNAFEKSTH